jgi:hypothetical protein
VVAECDGPQPEVLASSDLGRVPPLVVPLADGDLETVVVDVVGLGVRARFSAQARDALGSLRVAISILVVTLPLPLMLVAAPDAIWFITVGWLGLAGVAAVLAHFGGRRDAGECE